MRHRGGSILNRLKWVNLIPALTNAWDWSRIQLIAFHAGSEYRRFLVNYFRDKTLVSIPLQGLGIGEQLSFYKREGY
ncbi:DUF6884 domain-containing protein [Thermoactinomyces sp. CICC 10523]|uniref:DUF6884 domain-containing protein n=1 Tax=Thermoactinomyces sp. CICC 10523 TaxID=2767428 RepID=UPI00351C9E0D